MRLRFWRPSLSGPIAAKHFVTGGVALVLLVALFTASWYFLRPAAPPPHPSTSTSPTPPLSTSTSPRLEVFQLAAQPDKQKFEIYHRWLQAGGAWSGWEDLGSSPGEPLAAAEAGGVLSLFTIDESRDNLQNTLEWKQLANGQWSDWQPVDFVSGYVPVTVSLTGERTGVLDVFVTATHPSSLSAQMAGPSPLLQPQGGSGGVPVALFHRQLQAGHQTNWENLGGGPDQTYGYASYADTPTVTSWEPGRLDVFSGPYDAPIYHKWYANGHWSTGWENVGGSAEQGWVAATSWGPGRLDVVLIGADDFDPLHLWHKTYHNGQWIGAGTSEEGWERLGAPSVGQLERNPALVSWGPGRLDVFAVGSNDQMYHKWYDNGWSAWEGLGRPTGTENAQAPAVVAWTPTES